MSANDPDPGNGWEPFKLDSGLDDQGVFDYVLNHTRIGRIYIEAEREDVAQEVYLKIDRRYGAWRAEHGPGAAKAWVQQVAWHEVANWFRRRRGRHGERPELEEFEPETHGELDTQDLAEHLHNKVTAEILERKLSSVDRNHLYLRFKMDMEYPEIETALGCTSGAPGRACRTHHIPNALKRARTILEDYGNNGV